MGTAFTVTVGAITYEAVEDVEGLFDAVATGLVRDDVTQRLPRTDVTVTPSRAELTGLYLESGAWGVAGRLERALPEYPAAAATFDVQLFAPGYRPAALTVTVPAGAALPVGVAGVRLRPFPVRIEGRVTRSTLNPAPAAAGAIVRIANRPGQALVALRTPLHGPHAQGVDVRPIDLADTATERALAEPAESGSDTVVLDDVTGLMGRVVGFDWRHQLELARVQAVDVAASTATLTGPLTRAYPRDTRLKQFTVSPGTPPSSQLDRDADAGDGLLVLDGALDPDTAAVQVGNPATPEVEFAAVGALSDADGFYAMEGIGGVETVDLRARATAVSPDGPRFSRTLEYGRRTNVVNLRLAP
jgi:hypothetical protein